MAIMKYEVKRQHFGDRMYEPGDEREADANEVQHLVANGVLVEARPPAKPKGK